MFDKGASYCRLVYKIEHLLGLGWEQYMHKNTIEEKPFDLRSVEIWKRKTKAAQKERSRERGSMHDNDTRVFTFNF